MTTRPGYIKDEFGDWVQIGPIAPDGSTIYYQSSAPGSPQTGDIWIDEDDDVPTFDSSILYRWTKTMLGGETSLSGQDNNLLSLSYSPGYESVFINGVLQVRGQDYIATTGNTITGLPALSLNDVVSIESVVNYSVANIYSKPEINLKFGDSGWTSYTPTFSISNGAFTLGNAIVSGKYSVIGKTVNAFVEFNYGSSTSVATTNPWLISLPVPAKGNAVGSAWILDSGTRYYIGACKTFNSNSLYVYSSETVQNREITSTSPMTWANGDAINLSITYEAL
jgi:hypothetical protein